jgi:hypothetical protein
MRICIRFRKPPDRISESRKAKPHQIYSAPMFDSRITRLYIWY